MRNVVLICVSLCCDTLYFTQYLKTKEPKNMNTYIQI